MNNPDETPQTFQPDACHAVPAQQEEISRLRVDNTALADRIVYLSACLRQMQAEVHERIATLSAELSRVKGQLNESQESHKAEAEATVPPAQTSNGRQTADQS